VTDQDAGVGASELCDLVERVGASLLVAEVAGHLGERPIDEPLSQAHAEGSEPADVGQRSGC
jgi:hypothetical protein